MSNIIGQLILQIILILLNAFFAATEIAVISLNEKKVRARVDSGDKRAVRILKMIEEPTQFLSTIQIGITLAGFLGSAFAADNFAERLSGAAVRVFHIASAHAGTVNTAAVIVITLILSYFTLVLGELVPKRVAMKNKERLAEAICGTITGLAAAMKPVIWLLTVSTNGVLRLFGIDPKEKEEPVSEEDIVIMLDAGADEGSLDQNDIVYIKNVFKLDGMTAQDVMTPRRSIVMLPQDADRDEILRTIENEGFSRIPVYADSIDGITGILHTRDYLLKSASPGFKLEDAMLQPTFVPTTARLDDLFKDMQKKHNHIVIVINEFGETAGVVTMEDILEEFVGEIWDEGDEAVEPITRLDDKTYRVLGAAGVKEFFEFFSLVPSDETDAATVNGWIVEQIKKIPEQGFSFDCGNLSICITQVEDLMAKEITVKVNE